MALASLCQLALALLLGAAALHLARSGLRAWSWPLDDAPPPPTPPDAPTVTVQLPLRNERAVAERVIRAACTLDWPADRLQIQVLDDSDDETSAIVDRVVATLRAAGRPVEVVRREGRTGFKAGNLANGLAAARGEYLLVLDADSVPAPDVVRRLIAPLLADPSLGFAQGRWAFDNEQASLLTRVQALILDGLMLVEQPLLDRAGLPVQFNGSAGMWRRAALEAAGGWLGTSGGASVTEDLDLSYRARLAGFRGRHLPEVVVGTELPSTMAAFRAQQQRWVRGGGAVLRGLFRRLAGGSIPARERAAMLSHLARHARQPLLLAAAAWLPASVGGTLRLPLSGGVVWPAIVIALHLGVALYYGAALRRRGRSPAPAFLLAPVIVALSMGMSLLLTVALLRGVVGGAGGEFVRTPKARAYRSRLDWQAPIEVVIGCACLAASVAALARGEVAAAIALGGLVAAGFFWVGLGSIFDR